MTVLLLHVYFCVSVARSVTPDCSILEEDPYFDMTPVSTPGSAPGSNRGNTIIN